jgi:hypothetical protein
MTSSTSAHFEGCDLKALGSTEILLLSRCWRESRMNMAHRPDGKVDLILRCDPAEFACARALRKASPPIA